jgi:hypothetical protein
MTSTSEQPARAAASVRRARSRVIRRNMRYGLSTLAALGAYWARRLQLARSPLFEPWASPPGGAALLAEISASERPER